MRNIFAWSLPPLLLLVVGRVMLDTEDGRGASSSQTMLSAHDHSRVEVLDQLISYQQSVRAKSRRLAACIGTENPVTPNGLAASHIHRPQNLGLPPAGFTSSLNLATGWQFRWRTASEPRAPSSTS